MHGCGHDGTASQPRSGGAVDLADIIRVHGPALRGLYPRSAEQTAALRDIERCRTAVLGGHLDVCTDCGHTRPSYNSCRNRHCPKCQALRQAEWVESRVARTLPAHHFHAVFTLPAGLRPLASLHHELVYDLLFDCASATLLELGRDPKRLDGQLGITAVLHTWTRDLALHPHVHCIVTGGALSADGTQWHSARPNFLFPVAVMRELFRGKVLDGLKQANAQRRLLRPDGRQWLEPSELRRLMRKLERMKWVVYCKRPFGGSEQVIKYLGRYTHRVAISNSRLLSVDERGVTCNARALRSRACSWTSLILAIARTVRFKTRDGSTATLEPVEFLRRFSQHVLPARFVRIRHYGLMAAGNARRRWKTARALLDALNSSCPADTGQQVKPVNEPKDWQSSLLELTGTDMRRCPACGKLAVVRRPLPECRAPPLPEAA